MLLLQLKDFSPASEWKLKQHVIVTISVLSYPLWKKKTKNTHRSGWCHIQSTTPGKICQNYRKSILKYLRSQQNTRRVVFNLGLPRDSVPMPCKTTSRFYGLCLVKTDNNENGVRRLRRWWVTSTSTESIMHTLVPRLPSLAEWAKGTRGENTL